MIMMFKWVVHVLQHNCIMTAEKIIELVLEMMIIFMTKKMNWICPLTLLHVNCRAPGKLRTSLVPCLHPFPSYCPLPFYALSLKILNNGYMLSAQLRDSWYKSSYWGRHRKIKWKYSRSFQELIAREQYPPQCLRVFLQTHTEQERCENLSSLCTQILAGSNLWTSHYQHISAEVVLSQLGVSRLLLDEELFPVWTREQMYWLWRVSFKCAMGGKW